MSSLVVDNGGLVAYQSGLLDDSNGTDCCCEGGGGDCPTDCSTCDGGRTTVSVSLSGLEVTVGSTVYTFNGTASGMLWYPTSCAFDFFTVCAASGVCGSDPDVPPGCTSTHSGSFTMTTNPSDPLQAAYRWQLLLFGCQFGPPDFWLIRLGIESATFDVSWACPALDFEVQYRMNVGATNPCPFGSYNYDSNPGGIPGGSVTDGGLVSVS